MAERLYLILDSKGTPLANAVLESPPTENSKTGLKFFAFRPI